MESRRLKSGTYAFNATEEECGEGSGGGCIACGAEAYGVEPDARRYPCEACGARTVYGLEELVVMGRVLLSEGEE